MEEDHYFAESPRPLGTLSHDIGEGWYPDPTNDSMDRWWSGVGWTERTRMSEVRPWWRWPLYFAAIFLSFGLVTLVALVLWHGDRYKKVGRTAFWLSFVFPLVAIAAAVILA